MTPLRLQAAGAPPRIYEHRLVRLQNPSPLLADHPEFIAPVKELVRYEALMLVDDASADQFVPAWRSPHPMKGEGASARRGLLPHKSLVPCFVVVANVEPRSPSAFRVPVGEGEPCLTAESSGVTMRSIGRVAEWQTRRP